MVVLAPARGGAAAALAELLVARACATVRAAGLGEPEVRPDDALDRPVASSDRAILLLRADAPGADAVVLRAALDDLAAGVRLSVGPALDASVYLVATTGAIPGGLLDDDGLHAGFAAAFDPDAPPDAPPRVGLLRSERRLRTADDAVALCADPLTPAEVRAALA